MRAWGEGRRSWNQSIAAGGRHLTPNAVYHMYDCCMCLLLCPDDSLSLIQTLFTKVFFATAVASQIKCTSFLVTVFAFSHTLRRGGRENEAPGTTDHRLVRKRENRTLFSLTPLERFLPSKQFERKRERERTQKREKKKSVKRFSRVDYIFPWSFHPLLFSFTYRGGNREGMEK